MCHHGKETGLSNHFVTLFVALETITIGFYILVSYHRTSAAALEAGLKYLVLGALSSGQLLFGIVLLYGVAGNPALMGHTPDSMHFGALAAFLAVNPHHFFASVGIVLVLAAGLGSLAGIPPLAGFMGKLFVFIAVFQAGARWLLVIAGASVVISIHYYFGWIKAAFFETWTPRRRAPRARPSTPSPASRSARSPSPRSSSASTKAHSVSG